MTERHAAKRLMFFFVLVLAMLLLTTTAFAIDYSVPIDSYDSFRNAVLGNGYDIDDAYGVQCFDGAGLLWRQLGRWLDSGGTGAAKGTWSVEYARIANAGSEFELIYNKEDVKRGDVVVFDGPHSESGWSISEYGHIGFADEDYNPSKSRQMVLDQNYNSRAYFSVHEQVYGSFLGAFRYKAWHGKQLTLQANNGGSITNGISGMYEENDEIGIAASADDEYLFHYWSSSNGGTFEDETNDYTTFTMPANDTTVTAHFKLRFDTEWKEWNATATRGPDADISGRVIFASDRVPVEVGCYLGTSLSDVNSAYRGNTANVLVAQKTDESAFDFAQEQDHRWLDVSFTASDFGVEALEPEQTYYYKLYIVLDDSELEYSYQEGQPSFKTLGDTLNALTVKAEKGGELLRDPSGSYVVGETIPLSAQAADGYVFSHWSSDLTAFSSGTLFENITSPSDCVLNMPNSPITVTACFKADGPVPSHYISFVSDPGGMLLQGTNGWYEENEPIAISAEAGEDSSFIEWISTNGTFENAYAPATVFYPTAANAEVMACFGPKPTNLTASTNSIDLGQVSQLQIIPAYEYVYLTNNGDYPVSVVLESSESFTLAEGKSYLAPGEEVRYMAAAKSTCQPGVYQEKLYFKTHEGDILAEVEMRVEITAASGVYTVRTGPYDVGDFGVWYTNITLPETRTASVQYLGDGTVELGQPYLDEYAEYFTIGTIGKTMLAQNEITTFTIRPNADIPPGMYSTSCRVPAYSAELDADLESSFAVSLYVYHGAVAASAQEIRLPKHYTEATIVEPVVVSFTNVGNTTLYQEIEQPELKYFTVNAVGYSEWPVLWAQQSGRSFLVSVAPKADLAAGEYSETLSLPFTTENNATLVENVSLHVVVEEESGEENAEQDTELEFEAVISPAESFEEGQAETIKVTISSLQTHLTEANFVSLSLDEQYLEAGDGSFVLGNGQLQIELLADYLNTLSVGNYEVDIAFTGETSSVYHYTFTLSVYEQEMCYLILPKSLTTIETEAFVGNLADGVVLPNTVVSIGSRAFADCENLMLINIPGSVEYIADDAFDGCSEELRLIVDQGSLGHNYAEVHGYPCYIRNPQ